MAWGRKLKPEHAGPKNGGGAWMAREQAKRASTIRRRADDHELEGQAGPGGPRRPARVQPPAPTVIVRHRRSVTAAAALAVAALLVMWAAAPPAARAVCAEGTPPEDCHDVRANPDPDPTPIPEPATAALLGAGILALLRAVGR